MTSREVMVKLITDAFKIGYLAGIEHPKGAPERETMNEICAAYLDALRLAPPPSAR